MGRVVKLEKVELTEPVNDLRSLGEKLQVAIQLTRGRIDTIKNPRTRLKTLRVLDRAEYMFMTISQTVQTVDRMKGFLERGFGLNIDSLFALTGKNEHIARVSTHGAMVLVNTGISHSLNELAEINLALDKEVKNA